VHIEFGSNDLETFWFALAAVLLRGDCVVVAHDYPKLINAPAAGLLKKSTRLGRAIAYRVLCPLLDSLLVRMVVRRAGIVVVLGEEAGSGWLDKGARRVAVLMHGGDPVTDNVPVPSQGECVLFAGFLGPGKGVDTLLEAWNLISQRTQLPLIVAGGAGPPNDIWIADLCERFSDEPNGPRFVGPIAAESDLQQLIGSAAVIVLPYRHSSPASGILVRAMCAGRPVVATSVPAAQAAIRDRENGIIVPIDDVDALADALLRLCQSPPERDRLGAAAAETALGMFSWTTYVNRLEKAYTAAGYGKAPPTVDI
jgi:glycosyltransferase involved in cell wall biosynthesis